jgi:GH15 family glucan-1,4-alpha-glucosidase
MAWVAFDRAIKGAETWGLPGPVARWKAIRAEIAADVCENGFNAEMGSFVRSYGKTDVDASLLLIPSVGFLPPDDPRVRMTVKYVEKYLKQDGLLLRYDTGRTDDGLPPGEGAFLACSFWLVDALILIGEHDEASLLFERLIGLCNDLGLLSEEYDPQAGRMLGNFPQAFSHIALVDAAFSLSRFERQSEVRVRETAK